MRFSEGIEMTECDVMFFGDSIFRYLFEHIPSQVNGMVPGIYFRSGAKVDNLFQGESAQNLVSKKTHTYVLHVGINDLKMRDLSVHSILESYIKVLADLKKKSPECEIFVSSVLPHSHNCWDAEMN